ncbi:unnamed protein product [Choristocarpus tenellus]
MSTLPPGKILRHETWHVSGVTASPCEKGSNSQPTSPVQTRNSSDKKSTRKGMRGMVKSLSNTSILGMRRRALVPKNPKSAAELSSMGWMLEKQGKLDEAEMLYSRHCVKAQKQHGMNHLDVAADLDGLVHLLHKDGKLEEAETLCRRALDIKKKALGPEHFEVRKGDDKRH